MELNTPYVEYSDKNGNKSKLELGLDVKSSAIEKFYTDHIKDHFDNAKSN